MALFLCSLASPLSPHWPAESLYLIWWCPWGRRSDGRRRLAPEMAGRSAICRGLGPAFPFLGRRLVIFGSLFTGGWSTICNIGLYFGRVCEHGYDLGMPMQAWQIKVFIPVWYIDCVLTYKRPIVFTNRINMHIKIALTTKTYIQIGKLKLSV